MIMIDDKEYNKMKELVLLYEQEKMNSKIEDEQKPYVYNYRVVVDYSYNPNYGDDRECQCGHSYYRHFDPYDNMDAIGCKYCQCWQFEEKIDIVKLRTDKINKILKKQQ